MKLVANSPETKAKLIKAINDEYNQHHFLRVSIVSGKHRTVKYNALSWAWYKQISIERGEQTPEEIHQQCKLIFGVKIKRRDEDDFLEKYDKYIKPLPYVEKLYFVSMLPITSEFSNAQMKEYLEEMQRHYRELPTDPVMLEFPDE